jgi:hypothetical protein
MYGEIQMTRSGSSPMTGYEQKGLQITRGHNKVCDYMIDGKRKAYLREYFTTACILHGKVTDLEEIKAYIVGAYVEKGLLEMIRPTYSRKPLCVVCESVSVYEKVHVLEGDDESYLTFILRGEPRYTEEVKQYIAEYVNEGLIALETTGYTKEKQYIVETGG